jgi:hypothetical protein
MEALKIRAPAIQLPGCDAAARTDVIAQFVAS